MSVQAAQRFDPRAAAQRDGLIELLDSPGFVPTSGGPGDPSNLASIMKEAQALGLTDEKLHSLSGMSLTSIEEIRNGFEVPNADTAANLCFQIANGLKRLRAAEDKD